MSNQSKKTSELTVANTISLDDRLVIVTDTTLSPNTKTVTFDTIKKSIIKNQTPTSNTASQVGSFYYDQQFLYVVVANNVIKKVSLETL